MWYHSRILMQSSLVQCLSTLYFVFQCNSSAVQECQIFTAIRIARRNTWYTSDTRYIIAEYIEVYRQGDRRETGSIHGFRRLPFLALRPQERQESAVVFTNEIELDVAEIFLDSSLVSESTGSSSMLLSPSSSRHSRERDRRSSLIRII